MKKISLHSLLVLACFAFITSCSKDVKAPVKKSIATAFGKTGTGTVTTTTTTTTQTQPPCRSTCPTHSCGGGNTYGSTSH